MAIILKCTFISKALIKKSARLLSKIRLYSTLSGVNLTVTRLQLFTGITNGYEICSDIAISPFHVTARVWVHQRKDVLVFLIAVVPYRWATCVPEEDHVVSCYWMLQQWRSKRQTIIFWQLTPDGDQPYKWHKLYKVHSLLCEEFYKAYSQQDIWLWLKTRSNKTRTSSSYYSLAIPIHN